MFSKNTIWQTDKNLQYREQITYYSRTGGDTFTSTTVARARRYELGAATSPSGDEVVPAYDIEFRVFTYFLGGVVPRVKDKLTDAAGVNWQVVRVRVTHAGAAWHLHVKRIP